MRPEGQLKTGAAAGSLDEAAEPATPAGLSWGDADLPPPKTPVRSAGERDIKGVFGLGAPPPPAGAMLDHSDDPVAGLFAADQTLPAPGINDAPSEAELGRWAATNRTSMFEEQVKDPPPPLREGPPPRTSQPGQRVSQPGVRREPARMLDLDMDATAPMQEPMQEPPPAVEPERKRRSAPRAQTAQGLAPPPPPAAAVDAPAAPAKLAAKEPPPAPPEAPLATAAPAPAAPARSGARKADKARSQEPARASEPEAAPPPKRRRFEHGPSKLQLIGLGSAALLALGSAGVLLDWIPLSSSSTGSISQAAHPQAAIQRVAPVPAAKAAPAKVAAGAPAVTNAASAAAKPSAAGAAPKPVQPPAKPQAVAAVAAPAQPAKPIAQPAPVSAAESSSEASSDSGSSKALSQARKLLAADNPEGAEALARQALTADAQDHHAMEILVRALMDQDRGADAVPFAKKMVQKRGRRVPYRLLLGDLLLMVGDEAGARSEWEKALELAPSDSQIKRRLGK